MIGMTSSNGVIHFVEYDKDFLGFSWNWLNDPEIRELTDATVFTKQQQEEWFSSLQFRDDYMVWGICYDELPIGVAGLKNIDKNSAEYFGYIGDKRFWAKGLSRQILDLVFNYAGNRKMNRIWLKVLKMNKRAIKAYLKYGFSTYKEDDLCLFMQKTVSGP